MKAFSLTFLLGCISYAGLAAISVTNTGSASPCANTAANGITPAYTNVGNIVVREGAATPDDFGMGTDQIQITTPAGWSFNTGAAITVTSTGSPTDFLSYSIGTFTSTSLTINLVFGGTANRDRIQISGIQVRPNTTGAASGMLSVAVTAGTANGLAGQDMADLSITSSPGFSLVSASPNPLCENSTLNLSSTATGGSFGYTSYTWNGPDGYSSTSASSGATIPSISILGDGVYSVTVTDGNGCKGMGTTSFVTVNGNPSITAASGSPNPICATNTLTLSSTATGGSNTYTSYTWNGPGGYTFTSGSSGATEANISTANAGVYTVTVTDNNGCQGKGTTSSVIVNTNPVVNSATATPNPLCVGSMLTLNSTATPGSGAISSYAWNGPSFSASTQNSSIASVTTANTGVYSMTVTDVNGCKATGTTSSVTVNTNPVVNSATATPNPLCVGSMLTLNSNESAGSGAINSYSWHGPNGFTAATQNSSIASVTTLAAGVYSITVGDVNGCSASGTTSFVTVNTNPVITAGASPNPLCVGANLALTSSPSGGSGVYSIYAWNGPGGFSAATQNATNAGITTAGAGVYSVTVTDNNGCSGSGTTSSVVVNTNPTILVFANPNPICETNTLNLTSTPSGGSTVYSTYVWSGPNGFSAATQNTSVSNITTAYAGVYSVTVTDNNGCKGSNTTAAVTVYTNPSITASASPNPICVGNTLTLTSTPSGGSGSYSSFAWSGPSAYAAATQNASRTNIQTTGAGVYSVVVTDNHGCQGSGTTSSVVVNTNPVVTATVTPNPVCVGNEVDLNSTVSGGSGTYSTYAWNGPNSFTAATQNTFISIISAAEAGTYSLTVTDNNGCSSMGTTNALVVHTNPTITATATPNPICYNSTLALNSTPAGGSLTYVSYAWNGPGGFTAATRNTTNPGITSSGAGVYTVTVTDNNGCSGSGTTSSVTVYVNPTITATVTPNPLCVGNTLSLNSTPADGSGTYTTFLWNGPSAFASALQNTTRTNIQTTGAGVYTVTVTDNHGCSGSTTTTPVVVNTNPTITATATPNPICVGNTLTLNSTPAGGSGSYLTFAWNGPNTFTDANQNTTLSNITTAGAGTYTVTVTDGNGCSGSGHTAAVVVHTNPTITATATPNPLCVGNTLTLNSTPAGGSLTYTTYAWSGPGGFSAAVRNTSNPNITTAGAGVYSVTVTDNNGCSGSGTTASVVVNTNPTITATATPNPLCVGSTLTLNSTPAGGSGTYSAYAWNGPSAFTAAVQNTSRSNIQTTGAGVYSVTVTDNNGCSGSGTTSAVVVNTNPTITATVTPNPICVGNTVSLNSTPAGGSGTYVTYAWSGPNTFSSAAQNTSVSGVTTAAAGAYSITVTDNNGCSGSGVTSALVVNTNPVIASANASPNPICTGNDLTLTSSATGGSGTYTSFAWSGPGAYSAAGQTAVNTSISLGGAGVYSVTVTDNNGCSGSGTTAAVVVNPTPGIVAGATPNPICATNTLSLNSTPSGGSGTYSSFAWNGPNSFTATAQNTSIVNIDLVNAGTYSVTVNDADGCSATATTAVVVNALPIAYTVTGGGSYCFSGAGVHIGLSNSETGVNYQLLFGSTVVATASGNTGNPIDFGSFTAAGSPYTVLATNGTTGCTNNMAGSVAVTILPLPNVFNVTGGGSYCLSGSGVTVGLDGSDAGVNYQLYANGTATGSALAGSGSALDFGLQTTVGTYTVLATDVVTTCTQMMNNSATVSTLPLPVVHNVAGGGTLCSGGTGFHIGMDGSDIGINYQLYNGSTPVGALVAGNGGGIDFGVFTAAGTYSVSATNSVTGCTDGMSGSATIIVNPAPVVFTVSGGGGYCFGGTGVDIGLTGSEVNVNYQLYNGSSPVGLPVAGSGSALDFGMQLSAGTYTVSATNTLTTCMSNMASSTVVVVNPLPNVYAVSGGGNYCLGGSGSDIQLSGSDAGVNYQPVVGGTYFGSPVAGTGAVPFDLGLETTAATYSVVAINPLTGCMSNMTGDATVGINPLPNVYNVSGGGAFCAGGSGEVVNLDNSDAGVNYQVYNGSSAVGAALPSTGGPLSFGPYTTAGTYSVQATDGTTGCVNNMNGSATIVVNPLPDAITGSPAVCTGAVTAYTDDSTGGAWSSFDPTIATIDPATGIITGVNAGTTTITYTLPTTCYITASILVNQTPGAITGNTNVCVGAVSTLSDALAGGTWSNATPSVATVNPVTGDVYGVSGGTDVVTYMMPTGCMITTNETVHDLPVLPAITPASASGVCVGATTVYSDATSGGTWSSSNVGIATANSSTGDIGGVMAGSATITYTYTDGFGCTNNTTLGINVNANPAVAIITGAPDVCAGASITLSDATAGGTWNSSSSDATINSMGVVTGVTAGSTIVSYTVTDGLGCSTTTVYALTVGDAMPASAILPVSSATLCGGNPVLLSVASSDTTAITYYQWMVAGGNITGANSSSYLATLPGVYDVTIGNGTCEMILASTNIIAAPDPTITYDSVANTLYTGSFATYQWFFNGNAVAGGTSSLINSEGDGTYMVVVTDGNGCSDTATYVIGTTGLITQTQAKNITIYPNPVSSVLYINAPGKVSVSVLSPDGKVIMDRTQAVSLNVGQLADGVYVIMIYDENNNLVKTDRFVKIQ